MKRLCQFAALSATIVIIPWLLFGKGSDAQSMADREALQGTWKVLNAESNGEPPPPGLLDDALFRFSGDNLQILGREGRYELNALKQPRQIDLWRGKVRQAGIYELNGDHVKICVGPADDRPKSFQTQPRTDHSLFILARNP